MIWFDLYLSSLPNNKHMKNTLYVYVYFVLLQGFANLPSGICVSSMGRPISYEQAVAWKVLNDDDSNHCLAFMFINWSFV